MFTISKVEAVNRILKGVDGTILANLDDPMNATAIQVVRSIEEATDKIQMNNEWNFNAEINVILPSDNDDRIATPSNWLGIKFRNWTGGSILELSVVDGYVYSTRLRTNQIGGSVTVDAVARKSYDECPGPIQNYILEKAKYEFLVNSAHFSGARAQVNALSVEEAFVAAQKFDGELRFGSIGYGPSSRDNLNTANWWGW